MINTKDTDKIFNGKSTKTNVTVKATNAHNMCTSLRIVLIVNK